MMRKIFFSLLTVFLLPAVSADDFEDFEQAAAVVAANYNRAVDSHGTRFENSYRQHVISMCELAKKVQRVINRLKLGDDLNLVGISEEIRRIYEENNKDFKANKNKLKKMVGRSKDPSTLFKILAMDIRNLKTMRFTTENGGSIKESLETKRRLIAYDRILKFFIKYQASYRKAKDDDSFMKLFDERMTALKKLGDALGIYMRARNPNARTRVNIQAETDSMLKSFYELHESQQKKKTYTVKRAGGSTTVNAISSEMHFALQNIRAFLIELNNAGFETDPPLSSSGKKESSESAEASSSDNRYENMSYAELTAELAKRRKEIYRSNTSMDGFDREALSAYLGTLSREQRRKYNKYLKEYLDSGYKNNQATRSAILQLHTQLISEKNTMTAKEMAAVLKRIDKQKKKEEKEFDVLD